MCAIKIISRVIRKVCVIEFIPRVVRKVEGRETSHRR